MAATLAEEVEYWTRLYHHRDAWPIFYRHLNGTKTTKAKLGGFSWTFTSTRYLRYAYTQLADHKWLVVMAQNPNTESEWAERQRLLDEQGNDEHFFQVYTKRGVEVLSRDGIRDYHGIVWPEGLYEAYQRKLGK